MGVEMLGREEKPPSLSGGIRLPRTFSALQHRNFRLFFLGQLISLIGTWMQNTAQSWLVVLLATPNATLAQAARGATGESEARAGLYLGLISAASSLPILFGSLYGGHIADRYSKRGIIVATQATQGILAIALAALTWGGHIQVWHVVLFAFLFGMTNVFDIPARQAFVVEMVGKQDLPNAIGLNSSLFNAARAFGPAVAGVLLATLHGKSEEAALAECFLLNGLSYIAVIIGLLMMRGDFGAKATSAASPLEATREVFGYLKRQPPMLLLIGLVASFSLFVAPYFILLPSLAKFTLHTDARQFGLLMSSQGIGALLGALMVATLSEYPHKGWLITGASLTAPVLVLLLALTHSFATACVLVALIGFAFICFLATANTLLQTSTPDHLRGRVMGLYSVIMIGLTPVGSLWAGVVARIGGAPAAIAAGAVILGIAAVLVAIRYPNFRRMRQTLPERL